MDPSHLSCSATDTIESPSTAPILSDSSKGLKEPPQQQQQLTDVAKLSVSKIVDVSVLKMSNDKVNFDEVQTTPSEVNTKVNFNAELIDCDNLVSKSVLLDAFLEGSNTENFNSVVVVGNLIRESALETSGVLDIGTGVQNPKADHFSEVGGFVKVNEISSQTYSCDGDGSFSLVTDSTNTGGIEDVSNGSEHFDLVEGEFHIYFFLVV